MPSPQSLQWIEPLECAAALEAAGIFGAANWILLYSGVRTSYSGRYSILAFNPLDTIESHDLSLFAAALSNDKTTYENAWFGYLGYGLKDSLETLEHDKPGAFTLPNLVMTRYADIIRFDHDEKTVTVLSGTCTDIAAAPPVQPLPEAGKITSNMSKTSYLANVASLITRIHDGEFYQANLTRKFYGTFAREPHAFSLFRTLCRVTPAAYSAFIKIGDTYVLSSSPEQFMSIDANGTMRARPIKGTMPRFADLKEDEKSRQRLENSEKDRAENLMIVDLMRNDFSRSCIPGSVAAESLFDITSHATVHHLSSTVVGQKISQCSTIDAISHCFPPGSMTGAPKIRAMNACTQLEQLERGIYSGAIGWLGGDGSGELSVVIRTLICRSSNFEFQVGGGIVSDSNPELERLETIDKAKGILIALGITQANLQL